MQKPTVELGLAAAGPVDDLEKIETGSWAKTETKLLLKLLHEEMFEEVVHARKKPHQILHGLNKSKG